VAERAVLVLAVRYFNVPGRLRYAHEFVELDAAAVLAGQQQFAKLPRAHRDDDAERMGADMKDV
jgi:hypothetical protein